ncbi:ion channel [Streptomyces sp. NPDC087440]|uniref:ion channel n=1 Tax=Streptomyces sp. NPDC087440 TaxID=3365790 RepID=UPI0037F5F31C
MTATSPAFVARWEQRSLPWLTLLAVVSLAVFVITAATPHPPAAWRVVDYGIWAVFVGDFLLRLALAPQRWQFLRRNPLDLLALLLPSVRALRLLSILGRLSVVAGRGRAERMIASTGVVVAVVVVALAAAVLSEERGATGANITTLPDALWWAMTTITTVGYGDLAPVTPTGRAFGAVLMVVGIGAMGTVTAAVASRLVQARAADAEAEGAAAGAVGQLRALGELYREGVLTPDEFAVKKRELLDRW